MIRLGITGGIGSGKSTVSELFKLFGIPVYIADIESKKLTETSQKIKIELIKAFGEELYKEDILNKPLLAKLIFSDKKNLNITNSIIHPEVDKHYVEWVDKHMNCPLIGLETAILFESNMVRMTDKVLVVSSPLEERIKRTMLRDQTSREKVVERINSQMSEEEKISRSDYIVYNDEKQSLILQVEQVIKKLKRNGQSI